MGMRADLPAELALVVACCRWPPSPAREAAVRAAASGPIDWDRFDRVVARHRVAALARDGLRRAGVTMPPAAERRQIAAAAAFSRTALAMARETIRLQRMFDKAGLPALFLKGSTLAALAYGTLGIKQSWDIDLLTTPENALAGRRLLLQLGYQLLDPSDLDERQFARFSTFANQAAFFNAALSIPVELHWGLTKNDQLIPTMDAFSSTQTVPIAGVGVRTLQDEPLFAYLCTHGTWHGWARLKWLADLNAFLAWRDQAEVERLYRTAVDLGAGRTPAVALLLCHRLLGLSLSESMAGRLRADRVTTALAANSLYCAGYRRGEVEYTSFSVPGMRIKFASLFLVPGQRYFWTQLRTKLTSPGDRVRIELPRPLAFLYYLLRVPLWLARQWRSDR
jgi:hypothetical protein